MSYRQKEEDFTNMWWEYGWRGQSPNNERIMSLQSAQYGLAFDTAKASMVRMGVFKTPMTIDEVLESRHHPIMKLPKTGLTWQVDVGGKTYVCQGSSPEGYDQRHLEELRLPLSLMSSSVPSEQTRMIESGRYVQRFDMEKLIFRCSDQTQLAIEARVEVSVLPDFFSVQLEVEAVEELEDTSICGILDMGSSLVPSLNNGIKDDGQLYVFENKDHRLSALYMPCQTSAIDVSYDMTAGLMQLRIEGQTIAKGARIKLNFIIIPDSRKVNKVIHPIDRDQITVTETRPFEEELPLEYLSHRGIYKVELPDLFDYWDMDHNRDLLESAHIKLVNPYDHDVKVPIMFTKPTDFAGHTGLMPMFRDKQGFPMGLPIQLSKNWHQTKGKTLLYQGPWFNGYSLIELKANETLELEMCIAYAQWGGLPSVSHAQLCLIGYGVNQLWDQVAIGSYGESICYDPDVNLGRAMIDDVRPLMTESMKGERWNWTNNVGGGDFLVYFDEAGDKQFLTQMKTYYKEYGPNLTEVHYAGTTSDHKMSAHIRVSSPRCDDINRAYHYFKYTVNAPMTFSRLAFYQLGADGYNNHQFGKMAYGNTEGLIKEWSPSRGGLRYETRDIVCEGQQPWFSLHESVTGLHYGGHLVPTRGAWANRGFIIRSWKAVLGGKTIEKPYASVYLTEDHVDSSNVEISPPSDITQLLPGDYVECEIELVILPTCAEDYYGPNQGLRKSLLSDGNTWQPVHRQAIGNHLEVTMMKGQLHKAYPIRIAVDKTDCAEFEVMGGISYVPLTIVGLKDYKGWVLKEVVDGRLQVINQEVHGNDYWQVYYDHENEDYSMTYNIQLEGHVKSHYIFERQV